MKELFNNKEKIGKNINNIIKRKGHTKISFSKITGVPRVDLDKLINAEYTNIDEFLLQINKIIEKTDISLDDILSDTISENISETFLDSLPKGHKLSPKAKQMFAILDDITHLCELYY